MSNDCSNIDSSIFKRNGANQKERYSNALEPNNLELQDFEIEDWLLFAYNFAQHVNFFDVNDDVNPSGDWQELFNHFGFLDKKIPKRTDKAFALLKEKITQTLAEVEVNKNFTPHMTLFVCFLKLLELSKKRLNLITGKHLDFFYNDILKIQKLPAKADKVNIIFELAKKSIEERIAVGTALDAGKDKSGNKLTYKTSEEFIANKTSIAYLKNIYNDFALGEIKNSEIANSLDGQGEALKDDAKYWFPFGYTSKEKLYTELGDAKLGFAIASEILSLKEGERNIAITITFKENFETDPLFKSFTTEDLLANISIFCSGEKDWLGEFKLSENITFKTGSQSSSIAGNQLKLVFKIPKDSPSIVNYDQKILGENFNSNLPIFRFLINTAEPKGHLLFRNLVLKQLSNITVKVEVKDVKSLLLESDTGSLNAAKPFYPFTTQPEKNSAFTINYPELFSKKWITIDINIKWKNTPSSFKTLYAAYKNKYLETLSQKTFIDGMFIEIEDNKNRVINQPEAPKKAVIAKNEKSLKRIELNPNDAIVTANTYFKASISILNKEVWDIQNKEAILFIDPDSTLLFESNIQIDGAKYLDIDKAGAIRLSLNQSFLHSIYPKIYTLAIINTVTNPAILIPNEPYTPMAESISLNYAAEESINFNAYESNRVKLFHEAPFGQQEEHSFLKQKAIDEEILEKETAVTNSLVPDYCNGGEFYIGLKDAEALQQISLLFQILEGSENTKVETFTGKQKVRWSVLCNNYWKSLDNNILANGIDNFLKSGIVKFSIPKQATTANTLFPTNTIWIKAKMHKDYDAVCKIIDVKTQVVTAEFSNDQNNLFHLNNGLPAQTISKLVTRIPQIKSVSQPFNSFEGKPIESNTAFYQRVSERLRHKNRAITLWDYEHLVLQEFPEVFRVKCINHTYSSDETTSFLSPGNVMLVVIPDIVNKNVFDIYEPRVSTATLNRIKEFIYNRKSMLVQVNVINPEYEKVILKLRVKFYPKYDENFYKKQLNEDLIKLLSPWAFDNRKEIVFGAALQRSIVIDYVEKLEYVDFLSELEMAIYIDKTHKLLFKELEDTPNNVSNIEKLEFQTVLSPSSPKNILVSVKNHIVDTNIVTCKIAIPEKPETCQY